MGEQSLTLLVVGFLEPIRTEQPFGKNCIPPVDDQRLASRNDMDQNEFLKLLLPKTPNLLPGYSLYPFEIRSSID